MMKTYQFGRTVRSSAIQEASTRGSSVMGSFDPLNLWLDIKGDMPADDADLRQLVLRNPTYFHELVHCWQTFGSTSGFLAGAICPMESVMVPQLYGALGQGRRLVKPLTSQDYESTDTLSDERGSGSQLNWVLSHFYVAFEQFNGILDDPKAWSRFERGVDSVADAVKHGHRVNRFAEESLLRLVQMVKEEIQAVTETTWPSDKSALSAAYEEHHPGFYPDDGWLRAKVGMLHIHEGQARILELQLRAASDNRYAGIADIESGGLLSGIYRRAYDRFLEITGIAAAETILDWQVHLFIAICDFALNPTLAYLDDVDWAANLINEFHPGVRFERSCQSIAATKFFEGLISRHGSAFAFSHEFMNEAFNELEAMSADQNKTSLLKVAQTMAELSRSVYRETPNIGSPINTLLRKHFLCMLMRLEDRAAYASPLARVLDHLSIESFVPPIISANGEFRLPLSRDASWAQFSPQEHTNIRFPVEQVYSDLVRQLVSCPGNFEYDHPWIPGELAAAIKEGANVLFTQLFGFGVEDISLASEHPK
jgi:hypothetical protein